MPKMVPMPAASTNVPNPYNVPGVTRMPGASTTVPKARTDVATPFEAHKAGLAELHQSEEFSDCKVICGPYHFKLHKVILASHSDYFKTAFKTGTFKASPSYLAAGESATDSRQEGSSGTIELKAIQKDAEYSSEAEDVCDDPEIVKLMVEYFYHYDYLRNPDPVPVQDDVQPAIPSVPTFQSAQSNAYAVLTAFSSGQYGNANPVAPVSSPRRSQVYIIEHAKVFAMAIKYQVEGLQDLAAAKFKQSAEMDWDHEDFAEAISIVHDSTPESVSQLRDIVADAIHEHFDALQNKRVQTVICNIPRLAYDLLKRKCEKPSRLVENGLTGYCPKCSQPLTCYYQAPGAILSSSGVCYSCGFTGT